MTRTAFLTVLSAVLLPAACSSSGYGASAGGLANDLIVKIAK